MRKQNPKEKAPLYLTLLPIPAILLLLVLFILPLFSTLARAFFIDGKFSLATIQQAFTSRYTQKILWFTTYQALLSTLLSLAIGLPGAYMLSNYDIKAKKFILAVCTIPFVLPSILVVLGFVIFYGNSGFLNTLLMKIFSLEDPPLKILYSFKAIILAHAFFNFPIILNLVTTYYDNLDQRLEMSSLVNGATKGQTFRYITLPRLLPSILSSSLLVFLFCFTSFAIILVLGGGPQYTTMEVEIYRRARITLDLGGASAYALVSIGMCLMILFLYNLTTRKMILNEYNGSCIEKEKKPVSALGKVIAYTYVILVAIFILAPMISIIVKSFLAKSSQANGLQFTLRWYKELFGFKSATGLMVGAFPAIRNSLIIAIIVALLSIPLSIMVAIGAKRQKSLSSSLIELLGMLPLAISSVIIGLGYYLIAAKIKGSGFTFVVLAHLIIALPLVLRSVTPELRKLPQSLSQSAQTLGASPFMAFKTVEIPLLKNALISGAIFAFAMSMGEINATITLASSHLVTLPIVMYRLIGSYNYNGACALGTILIMVCGVVFIVSEHTKRIDV